MQGDLIERLRGFALRVSEGINEACEEAIAAGEADNARIAALEADNARLMGLVKEAGEALDGLLRMTDFDMDEPWVVKAQTALAKIKEATDGQT